MRLLFSLLFSRFFFAAASTPACAADRESAECTLPAESAPDFAAYFGVTFLKAAHSSYDPLPAAYRISWPENGGRDGTGLPSSLQEAGVEVLPLSLAQVPGPWVVDEYLGVQNWDVDASASADAEVFSLTTNQTVAAAACSDPTTSSNCATLHFDHRYLYPGTRCSTVASLAFASSSDADQETDGLPPPPCQSPADHPLLISTATLSNNPETNGNVALTVRVRVRDVEPFWRDAVTVSTALGETRVWLADRAHCAGDEWVRVKVERQVTADSAESVTWTATTEGVGEGGGGGGG
jgi:hypothetical protein